MKAYELVHELVNTAAVFGRNGGVSVHFEGEGAYTDGKEVKLPALPQGAEFSQEAAMVMRGYIDHEAGHVRHSDFETMKDFVDTHSLETKDHWNSLEDIWMERKVMDEYPGAEKNIRTLTEMISKKEYDVIKGLQGVDFDAPTYQNASNAILRRGKLGYGSETNTKIYDEYVTPKFKEWSEKWIEEVHKCENSKQVMNLTLAIERLLQKDPESGEAPIDQIKPEDFEYDPDGDVTEGKPKKSEKEQEAEARAAKAKGKGKPTMEELFTDWLKSEVDQSMKMNPVSASNQYTVLTTRGDEVYRRNKTPKRNGGYYDQFKSGSIQDYERQKGDLGGVVNTMKSRLRRALMAKEQRDWDFGREFGKIDAKRLVAGSLGSPSVYKQKKDRQDHDTAVLILVDLSGSMGGDKVVTAGKSAIAFAECLEGTQIKYEIVGFNNGGNFPGFGELTTKARTSKKKYHRVSPQNLFMFKEFNEPLRVAKDTMSAIQNCAGGDNADRDAVLWCKTRLHTMPQKRKVLLVLSDGQPATSTLGGVSYDELGAALKGAVEDTMKSWVEVVGIGIEDDSVEHYYKNHVVINNVSDLSGTIFTQLSNLLTGGKVQL